MKAHTTNEHLYTALLNNASMMRIAEWKFWKSIVTANDDGQLQIMDVRKLIEAATGKRPSEATAYRQLAKWTDVFHTRLRAGNGVGA